MKTKNDFWILLHPKQQERIQSAQAICQRINRKGVMSAAVCVMPKLARQKALRIFIGFRSQVVPNAIAAHLIDKTGMKNACLDMTA